MSDGIEEVDQGALTDPLDVASRQEMMGTALALAAQRLRSAPEQRQNPDGTWPTEECLECGEPLGARLIMGKVRCVLCQSDKESKLKRGIR